MNSNLSTLWWGWGGSEYRSIFALPLSDLIESSWDLINLCRRRTDPGATRLVMFVNKDKGSRRVQQTWNQRAWQYKTTPSCSHFKFYLTCSEVICHWIMPNDYKYHWHVLYVTFDKKNFLIINEITIIRGCICVCYDVTSYWIQIGIHFSAGSHWISSRSNPIAIRFESGDARER